MFSWELPVVVSSGVEKKSISLFYSSSQPSLLGRWHAIERSGRGRARYIQFRHTLETTSAASLWIWRMCCINTFECVCVAWLLCFCGRISFECSHFYFNNSLGGVDFFFRSAHIAVCYCHSVRQVVVLFIVYVVAFSWLLSDVASVFHQNCEKRVELNFRTFSPNDAKMITMSNRKTKAENEFKKKSSENFNHIAYTKMSVCCCEAGMERAKAFLRSASEHGKWEIDVAYIHNVLFFLLRFFHLFSFILCCRRLPILERL